MATKAIQNELPVIYRKFFPSFFKTDIPVEEFANCANCSMVCTNNEARNAKKAFLPDKKCCTYHPSIPNYLIGALLADKDPLMAEGQRRVREKIKNRTGVTPAGVYPSNVYRVTYAAASSEAFGNSASLLCPFFNSDTGGCTVWKYREAVCSTYFCKTVSAEEGDSFWMSLKRYLSIVQDSLAIHGMLKNNIKSLVKIFDEEMGYAKKPKPTVEELDGQPTSMLDYKKIWGDWHDKEEAFFINCFHEVDSLDEIRFRAIMGVRHDVILQEVENKRDSMLKLPNVLKKNTERNFKNEDGMYKINMLKIDFSFSLPVVVLDAFDGSLTCDEVKRELEHKHNIELEDEVIIALYTNNLLTA